MATPADGAPPAPGGPGPKHSTVPSAGERSKQAAADVFDAFFGAGKSEAPVADHPASGSPVAQIPAVEFPAAENPAAEVVASPAPLPRAALDGPGTQPAGSWAAVAAPKTSAVDALDTSSGLSVVLGATERSAAARQRQRAAEELARTLAEFEAGQHGGEEGNTAAIVPLLDRAATREAGTALPATPQVNRASPEILEAGATALEAPEAGAAVPETLTTHTALSDAPQVNTFPSETPESTAVAPETPDADAPLPGPPDARSAPSDAPEAGNPEHGAPVTDPLGVRVAAKHSAPAAMADPLEPATLLVEGAAAAADAPATPDAVRPAIAESPGAAVSASLAGAHRAEEVDEIPAVATDPVPAADRSDEETTTHVEPLSADAAPPRIARTRGASSAPVLDAADRNAAPTGPPPVRHQHVPLPSAAAPAVPRRVEFTPRRALQRLLGLLVFLSLAAAATTSWLAYESREVRDIVFAGIMVAMAVVLASIRATINPVQLIIEGGQLYLRQGHLNEFHDLTSPYTDVTVTGDPAGSKWEVTISRHDAPTRRIGHDIVDGKAFVPVVRYWRAE